MALVYFDSSALVKLVVAHSRGKDLGIMNLAAAVPSGLAPLLGALVVTTFGNFQSLFIVAVIIGALSAVAAVPIRSVR